MKPVTMIVVCETSGVQPDMSYIAQALTPRPAPSSRRDVDLADQAADQEHADHRAMPRGPMTMPAVTTG
jgi:hypothetical protein